MTSRSKDVASSPAGQERNQQAKITKNISNPRRLFILSPNSHSQDTIPPLLHTLTGVAVTAPPQTATNPISLSTSTNDEDARLPYTSSFAGYTTHAPLRIQTKYYTADVPIWVDEIPLTFPSSSSDSKPDSSEGSQDPNAPTPTTAQWKTEFLSSEARVVRDAIGAVVICVRNLEAPSSAVPNEAYADTPTNPTTTPASERPDVRALKDLVRMIAHVKSQTEEERGEMGEVPGILVLITDRPSGKHKKKRNEGIDDGDEDINGEEVFGAAWWEDELYDMGVFGFEVVVWDPKTEKSEAEKERNQFGEYEGMRRIQEVLETHDWAAAPSTDDNDLDFLHLDEENDDNDGFRVEVSELEQEMMGLRFAVRNSGEGVDAHSNDDNNNDNIDDMKVEELETLMMRMRAIKDMSADLPESQRKAFASKAIRDIMQEL